MGAEATRVSLDGEIKGRIILNILSGEFFNRKNVGKLKVHFITTDNRVFCKSNFSLSHCDKIKRIYYNVDIS